MPLRDAVAAVSVGIVDGVPLLDLTYEEDSRAEVDFNVVMTASGEFVEVQGSAESAPFPRATLDEVLRLAGQGIRELLEAQSQALAALEASSQPTADASRVLAQPGAAEDVDVPVLLGLHRVGAEVGEQAKAVRAVLLAHLNRHLADVAQVAPELLLRHVLSRHDEQHHRHPAQPVAEDDDLLVLVDDLRRRPLGDDLAEQAMVDHRWLRGYARGSWRHSR